MLIECVMFDKKFVSGSRWGQNCTDVDLLIKSRIDNKTACHQEGIKCKLSNIYRLASIKSTLLPAQYPILHNDVIIEIGDVTFLYMISVSVLRLFKSGHCIFMNYKFYFQFLSFL